MESDVWHGAKQGAAGGCQNYSGMLWELVSFFGEGWVCLSAFLWVNGVVGGFQRDFQSSRRNAGVKTHLWPEEAVGCLGQGFSLVTVFKASVYFLCLILLEDIKLKPSSQDLAGLVLLFTSPKIKLKLRNCHIVELLACQTLLSRDWSVS